MATGEARRPPKLSTWTGALMTGAAVAGFLLFLSPPFAFASATSAPAGAQSGFLSHMLSFVIHLDKHLNNIIAQYGAWTYAVLFGIVFAETGLVVTPFLPGDSLLFACGTLAALGSLNYWLLLSVLFVAAVLGDTVNYSMGAWLGSNMFTEKARFFKKSYITKTEAFYEKYGGKTVVLARFVPIVRTFAPFVAGVGSMNYSKFLWYNIFGAAIWTVVFTAVGYFFGTLPFVQSNFSVVVLGIVLVSLLPIVFEVIAAKKEEADASKENP